MKNMTLNGNRGRDVVEGPARVTACGADENTQPAEPQCSVKVILFDGLRKIRCLPDCSNYCATAGRRSPTQLGELGGRSFKLIFPTANNEVVDGVGPLRALLASGQVKQGDRVIQNRNERVDTKDGPITVGGSVTIHDWLDHSVS